MKLTGNNLLLRAIEPTDIDILYSWENDTTNWKLSNTQTPFSKHVLLQYIDSSHLDIYTTKQLRLIIEETKNQSVNKSNNAVGCIDLFDFDPNHLRAGVGILVAANEDRRKGYATEALKLLIDYCFSLLNLNQLYCNIMVENEASILLFKKQGFEITGVKKSWLKEGDSYKDELFLQLIKR